MLFTIRTLHSLFRNAKKKHALKIYQKVETVFLFASRKFSVFIFQRLVKVKFNLVPRSPTAKGEKTE